VEQRGYYNLNNLIVVCSSFRNETAYDSWVSHSSDCCRIDGHDNDRPTHLRGYSSIADVTPWDQSLRAYRQH
jgi:hypothetical protein